MQEETNISENVNQLLAAGTGAGTVAAVSGAVALGVAGSVVVGPVILGVGSAVGLVSGGIFAYRKIKKYHLKKKRR